MLSHGASMAVERICNELQDKVKKQNAIHYLVCNYWLNIPVICKISSLLQMQYRYWFYPVLARKFSSSSTNLHYHIVCLFLKQGMPLMICP